MTRPGGFRTTSAHLGHYLRDIVYGASDGVVTTLAIVAAVAGSGLPPRVALVLGVANLFADGLSMGAGNYLGLKSELEQHGRPVSEEGPAWHGLATLLAFIVFGGLPLLAYVLAAPTGVSALGAALLVAAIVLAGVGGARAPFTGRGRLGSALEMLVIGGIAAAVAYGVGLGAQGVVG